MNQNITPNIEDKIRNKLSEIISTNFHENLKDFHDQCILLESKRNHVFCVRLSSDRGNVIVKIFNPDNLPYSLTNEKKIYEALEPREYLILEDESHDFQLKVPKLLFSGEDYLIFEYIDGENLMDLIQKNIGLLSMEDPFWSMMIYKLVNWNIEFYKHTGMLLKDNHVRNYLVSGKILYAMDFEELMEVEDIVDDFVHCFAYLYFSILSAYPGIIEGQAIHYKQYLGLLLIKTMLESSDFIQNEILSDVTNEFFIINFLTEVRSIGLDIIERRIRMGRGKNLDKKTLERELSLFLTKIRNYYIH